MSKDNGQKGADPRREERRRAQLAALRERAATEPAPPPREHIEHVDISGKEEKYEPLLHAIESGLVAAWDARDGLLVDDEAERALRLLIARYEGDADRRSGSADVDLLADRVTHRIDLLFRRQFFSRAEIIGCLRRVVDSVRTHHEGANPRAYFEFVADFIVDPEEPYPAPAGASSPSASSPSPIWTPGGLPAQPIAPPRTPDPPRRSGLWLPGDKP